jgi:hypothetical protein
MATSLGRLGCDATEISPYVPVATLRIDCLPNSTLEMGPESINLLNRAIRPLGFDRPLLAVTEHYAEDRFARNLGHSDFYRRFSRARKTNRLP